MGFLQFCLSILSPQPGAVRRVVKRNRAYLSCLSYLSELLTIWNVYVDFFASRANTKEDRNKRASQNNNSTRRTHTNCQPTNCRQMKSRKNRPYIRRRRQNCGPLKQPELRCPAWTGSMIDSSADDGYGTEPLEKYSPTIGIDNEPLYPIPENTHRQRRRHLLGVLLVLAVIIIWVSSSILIQVWYLPHLTIPMHKAHPPHFTQLHPRTPIGYIPHLPQSTH